MRSPCDNHPRSSTPADVRQRTTNGRTVAVASLPAASNARTAITWRPGRACRSTQRQDSFAPRTDLRRLRSTQTSIRLTRTLSVATARTIACLRSRERRVGDLILTRGRFRSAVLGVWSTGLCVPSGAGSVDGPGSEVGGDGIGTVTVTGAELVEWPAASYAATR